MTIKITDLYNDDVAEFKFLPEAWVYYHYWKKESKGQWWPLIIINGKIVSFEKFRRMCRKTGV